MAVKRFGQPFSVGHGIAEKWEKAKRLRLEATDLARLTRREKKLEAVDSALNFLNSWFYAFFPIWFYELFPIQFMGGHAGLTVFACSLGCGTVLGITAAYWERLSGRPWVSEDENVLQRWESKRGRLRRG